MVGARYDGVAEWYEAMFASYAHGEKSAGRLAGVVGELGEGDAIVLDVGCGTGLHFDALRSRGVHVVGVDLSMDQLRIAARRSRALVQGDAINLPIKDGACELVVATFVHTDVDDFAAMMGEVERVLRPGGRFIYIGTHPCFIGPFVSRAGEREAGQLIVSSGYGNTELTFEGSGTSSLKAKVGARNIPLGEFIASFLNAELVIERFEELDTDSRRWVPDPADATIVPWNVLVMALKP